MVLPALYNELPEIAAACAYVLSMSLGFLIIPHRMLSKISK